MTWTRARREIGSMLHWETDFTPPLWSFPEPAVYYSVCRHAIAALCAARPQRPTLWLPSFFCPEVARVCRSVSPVREYRDDPRWPAADWNSLRPAAEDLVLAVNYFGVRSPEPWYDWRQQHACILVEDHTQDPFSAWAMESKADYAVCSIRKTVPVPDGAILWSPSNRELPPQPEGTHWEGSTLKAGAMLYKRMYVAGALPLEFKTTFRKLQLSGEAELGCGPESGISPISRALISCGIPKRWREQRVQNARSLLYLLRDWRGGEPLFTTWPDGHAPFDLPFVFASEQERDFYQSSLQKEDIYCPVEWVCETADRNAADLSSRILSIPIDHRYNSDDMERIAGVMMHIEASGAFSSRKAACGRLVMQATETISGIGTTATRQQRRVLSGHQPVYLPGIILFNKIALSDVFMFVGHCQYVKKSWHSRNRIQLGDKELWLSVPVETAGRFEQAINATFPANELWKRKHLGSIRQAYGKAPYFDLYYPQLEATIIAHSGSLSDLNISLIKLILVWLDISTPVVDSRDYEIHGSKTAMLISMCRAVGATHYLSNQGSRAYVDEAEMAEAEIEHCWQEFDHPVYPQSGSFIPNLSVIDLLFNVGPASAEIVRGSGKFMTGEYAAYASTA